MRYRAFALFGSVAALGLLIAEHPRQSRAQDRPKDGAAEIEDQVDEARLNVELLGLELSSEKNQLKQQLQAIRLFEFGPGGMGGRGGGMGGFGGGTTDPEAMKKERDRAVASLRDQYEALKDATLETTRKLGREKRRLAALEDRLKAERPGGVAGPDPGARADDGEENPPGIEERLARIERKLDILLKGTENSKP